MVPTQELRKLQCVTRYDRPIQQCGPARTGLWRAPRLDDVGNASRVDLSVRREASDLNCEGVIRW
jgi:hypothetical protein